MDIYQCPSCFKAWTSYTYLLGTLPLPSSFLSLFFPLPPPLFSLVLFSLPLFSFPYLSSSSFSSLSLSFSLFLSLLPLSPFSLFLPSPSFSLPLSPWSFFQRKSVDDYDAMGRYSSQYEAQLDPFTAFSAKVRSCFFPVYTQLHSGSYPTGRTHWKQCIVNLLTNGVCYEFQRENFLVTSSWLQRRGLLY